ncbi:secreted RxLR effector protein 161-like [Rutidosis leptorrhynchoides]|uniref:secreted RxLR effector protein 161-like n=1 Tax=Rutidosis leptorrhynchoides TaxID=125765 RepID=UPI003A9948CD
MESRVHVTKEEGGVAVDPTKYRSIIRSLYYLINTRPYLEYAVGIMSRFMESPKECHFKAIKLILRYIKGTVNFGLFYQKGGDRKVLGYNDSSHGVDLDDRKGTTRIVFYYSRNLIIWCSSKQRTVALLSCEADFMAATEASCQALQLRNLLVDLTGLKVECVKIRVDNR